MDYDNPPDFPNGDAQLEDREPWPDADEDDRDRYGEYEPLHWPRDERDVCSVCLVDYGGTVGNVSKMTIKYFLCPRCAKSVANKEVA